MNWLNITAAIALACHGFPLQASAASLLVDWKNTPATVLHELDGITPLDPGSTPPPFSSLDGDVVQLGYFSEATSSAPLVGSWVALTGEGSATGLRTTIGDKLTSLPNEGRFAYSSGFQINEGVATSPDIPAIGTPLAIRFFDGTTIAGSTYFNTVSTTTGLWNWPDVTGFLEIFISLEDPSLVWQGGTGTEFRVAIPNIPEPAPVALVALALVSLATRRTDSHSSRRL